MKRIEKVNDLRKAILAGGELRLLAPTNPAYPKSWGRWEVRTLEGNARVYVEVVTLLGADWMEEHLQETEDGSDTSYTLKQQTLI